MKTKNKDKTPKFIALAVICLLVGAGIGLVSYHYLFKSDLAIFQGMKLPEENPAKLIYPNDVINTIFDDSEKINNTAGFLIKCYKPLTENQIQVLRDSGVRLLQASEIPTVYHSLIEENKVEEVESLDFVEYIYPYKTRIYTANKSKTFEEEFEGVLEDRFQSVLNSYWQRGETPPPMNPHGYFYLITDDKEYHISSSQLGKIVVKYEDFPIFKNFRKPAKIIGNVSDSELYPDKIIIGSVIYEKQTTKIEPTKEMVEKIVLYEDGPQEVIDQKSEEGTEIASLLTCKLHELNLQATCVFSEEDIYEMKKGRIGRRMDRMIELVLKNPIDIVISQWVEPEERYHIPVDEKGYRILENVKTALFILEDKGGGGLESHILVGHEVEGRIGYSCWAIQQEGSSELDKNWIKQIEKTLTLEEFCGWSTYGNSSSDSDCTAGGCSGQVCQSKYEEPVITTCEWRDCFDASKYGLKCRCIDGRCQWLK